MSVMSDGFDRDDVLVSSSTIPDVGCSVSSSSGDQKELEVDADGISLLEHSAMYEDM